MKHHHLQSENSFDLAKQSSKMNVKFEFEWLWSIKVALIFCKIHFQEHVSQSNLQRRMNSLFGTSSANLGRQHASKFECKRPEISHYISVMLPCLFAALSPCVGAQCWMLQLQFVCILQEVLSYFKSLLKSLFHEWCEMMFKFVQKLYQKRSCKVG
jgi:hypothetical protein